MPLPYFLRPGDTVAIVAPASRCSDQQLQQMQQLLTSWSLHCRTPENLFGETYFYANTDIIRLQHLCDAINDPEIKAIFIARGGYGSLRLIPELMRLKSPPRPKLFIGMSDTTALQLYFQQNWRWVSIHASAAPDRFNAASLERLRQLLFGEQATVRITPLQPLNEAARSTTTLQGILTGGNLAIVAAGIGTSWQLQAQNKIVLLEEVGERGYQIDRMLVHAQQVNLFKGASAILFGDFYKCEEPDGKYLWQHALLDFAAHTPIPVFQAQHLGHCPENIPLPLGVKAVINAGSTFDLTCAVKE